jgi:hypothetical protein
MNFTCIDSKPNISVYNMRTNKCVQLTHFMNDFYFYLFIFFSNQSYFSSAVVGIFTRPFLIYGPNCRYHPFTIITISQPTLSNSIPSHPQTTCHRISLKNLHVRLMSTPCLSLHLSNSFPSLFI